MAATQTVPQRADAATQGELYVSFELGDKKWKVTAGDGRFGPSQYSVDAGDKEAVLNCLRKAKERCKLGPQAKVHSCYEAGRDGWWLHRWLIEQGIDNIVVDAASIEVNRRTRRAKTDRLDGFKLQAMLLRHHGSRLERRDLDAEMGRFECHTFCEPSDGPLSSKVSRVTRERRATAQR